MLCSALRDDRLFVRCRHVNFRTQAVGECHCAVERRKRWIPGMARGNMSSLNPDPCARGSHATERVTVRRGDGLGELCAVAEPSEGNNSMCRTVPVLLGLAPRDAPRASRSLQPSAGAHGVLWLVPLAVESLRTAAVLGPRDIQATGSTLRMTCALRAFGVEH